eukprot:6192491-Pleurochrysis_carterae.AAC.1
MRQNQQPGRLPGSRVPQSTTIGIAIVRLVARQQGTTESVDRFEYSQMRANLLVKTPKMALLYVENSLDTFRVAQKCQWY